MSESTVKETIMRWVGPTSVFATPPLEDFIALGPDVVPAVIDIFSRPNDIAVVREFGTDVDLPALVNVLYHYAKEGDDTAGHALFEIANARIPAWGKHGKRAHDLAIELARKILEARTP